MTDTTGKLKLPLIAAQQAQKHVTHNEALATLDVLVQAGVKDRDLATPPASPAEGDCYIVASGASDDWSGHDGDIAEYRNGGWVFHAPREGWRTWVEDEGRFCHHTGSAWIAGLGGVQSLNPADGGKVGVNTTADATNRLAVKSDAVLFSHDDVTPGNGSVRFKVNKKQATNTASLLFQDNWSGRAEIGLMGNDDFAFKVSPDGSAWHAGIIINKDTGMVRFPSGGVREQLTASRTYYVNGTNGSDGNDGLSSGGAFKTIQKAIDTVAALDIGIYDVTINVAAGTYSENVQLKKIIGSGSVTLLGDTGTPANVSIAPSSGHAVVASAAGDRWTLAGFRLAPVSGGHSLIVEKGTFLSFHALDFAAAPSGYIHILISSARVDVVGDYAISGGAYSHWKVDESGTLYAAGRTITLSGTPAFTKFADCNLTSAMIVHAMTFNGSATGTRYTCYGNAVIYVAGAGPNYLPGDISGYTSNGGEYY